MKLILMISACFLCTTLPGQDVMKMPDILPGSPEVAAIAKNTNIPVSYSSGTPQIGIPIFSLRSGGMEVPVGLSYNASGIRVEETATWVGLGWSLGAGGQITRTIHGVADETSNGFLHVAPNRTVKYIDHAHCRCSEEPTGEEWNIWQDIAHNNLDTEPDRYNFSILGYSGEFFYNQDSAKFILSPYQNIRIEGSPGSFVLVLPNGVKAYFGGASADEMVLSGTSTSFIDGISYAPEPVLSAPYANAWMVTLLEEPTGRVITFNYDSEYIMMFGRGGERFGPAPESNAITYRQSFYKQYIKKPVLQSIIADNGIVSFTRFSTPREDIPLHYGGSFALKKIDIKTREYTAIRSFEFDYEYVLSDPYPAQGLLDLEEFEQVARKRMFLKSVREKSGNYNVPPYEFHYNTTRLPSRLSTSQDYWGYYNGRSNGTKLMSKIPSMPFYYYAPYYAETNQILPAYNAFFNPDGSDRRIDPEKTQAGILVRVKYPTGGYTVYEYEQNQVPVSQLNIYGGMIPPDMVERSYVLSSVSNPIPDSPPYPSVFPGSFTIKEPATKLRITPQLNTCSWYENPDCKFEVIIRALPSQQIKSVIKTNNVIHLQLAKGDYQVEVKFLGGQNEVPPLYSLTFEWGERNNAVDFPVGGLRVKKIVSYDGVNNALSRSFTYQHENGESSGLIEGCPNYKVHDVNAFLQINRQYHVSNSILPLTSDGKTVRYTRVTEYFDSLRTGFKNVYHFTSGITESDRFSNARTGAPRPNWNWQNNLLKKKEVFEKTGPGAYRIVASEEHFFKAWRPVLDLYGLYGPQLIPYSLATEWYLPDSSTSFSYSYDNNQQQVLAAGVKHYYNHHFLPSVTRTANSKGEIIDSRTWYAVDYSGSAAPFITSLGNRNIINVPVKQETSLNGKLLNGAVITYNDQGLPVQGYAYENAALTDTTAHNKNIITPSRYKLHSSFEYDEHQKIVQVNNYKAGPVSYIWDYRTGSRLHETPVAMVQNAGQNSIAYTSFENASKGNWTYSGTPTVTSAVMGSKAYDLASGSIKKTGLSMVSAYTVSYWAQSQKAVSNTSSVKTGFGQNGWTYFEHRVTHPFNGIITVSGSGLIDELRLYPDQSQMVSYDYDDRMLVAAVCDINNRITYYDYDVLGRLSLVRDMEGHILKKYCYHISGQQEDCGLGSDPHWQLTGETCEMVNDKNTGKMVRTETDTNPNSSSYGQTRTLVYEDTASCPPGGNQQCGGDDKKMINGLCETGVKVYTGSVKVTKFTWRCWFHYKWSDGSQSETFQEEKDAPCF